MFHNKQTLADDFRSGKCESAHLEDPSSDRASAATFSHEGGVSRRRSCQPQTPAIAGYLNATLLLLPLWEKVAARSAVG